MAGMFNGLSSWIYGQQQDQKASSSSSKYKANINQYEEPELIEMPGSSSSSSGVCSRGRRIIMNKTSKNGFGNNIIIQEDNSKFSSGNLRAKSRGHHNQGDDETGQESDSDLNEDDWTWICSEKENEPAMDAKQHNYAWYKLDDKVDINTISIHNEWQVTPPSCFTRANVPEKERLMYKSSHYKYNSSEYMPNPPSMMNEISIFENLLIEHPSMSIYDRFPERFVDIQRTIPKVKEQSKNFTNQSNNSRPSSRQSLKSMENSHPSQWNKNSSLKSSPPPTYNDVMAAILIEPNSNPHSLNNDEVDDDHWSFKNRRPMVYYDSSVASTNQRQHHYYHTGMEYYQPHNHKTVNSQRNNNVTGIGKNGSLQQQQKNSPSLCKELYNVYNDKSCRSDLKNTYKKLA